jgi:uncharacterized protein (DUF885 family)
MMRIFLNLLLPMAALVFPTVIRADWIEQSNAYAQEVIDARAALRPEYASYYGVDRFDADTSDLGPDISRRWQVLNRQLAERLTDALSQEKNPAVRQDLQIMIEALRDEATTAQIEDAHLLPYYDLHQMLFLSFKTLLDPRNEAARYPAALQRLRRYNGEESGFEPLTLQARARTEERMDEPALLAPFRGQLEKDLANIPSYVTGIRSLFENAGLEGWQTDLDILEGQLAAYQRWLEQSLLPRARPTPLLPPAVYADSLKNYGVRQLPEELIEEGQYSYQLLRSEMKSLALRIAEQRGWQARDLVPVIRALKQEQIPEGALLALYRERLRKIEDIIRRENLLTLPKRKAAIRLATEAEAAASPASFMTPPQLINNTGQYGEFVLVQTNPGSTDDAVMDDWSHEAITWALTAHEARPGHELQFTALVENGTSLARAIFAFNSANVEGWALYAESIMQEYLPLEGQFFVLFTRTMRAARMFLDPMVNTGRMSRDEAERFLIEQLALSPAMASSEADRYAFWLPGQATSYYVGYMNMMRLRTEVEIAAGDSFDQRAFHDFILEQGLLPPHMLREAVLQHFAR